MDNLKHVISTKSIHSANTGNYLTQIDSAVKDMKSSSRKMEKENFLMEKKLSDLKEKLKGEMDARKQSGGPRWRSSQVSGTHNKKNNFSSIKVLRDVPLDEYLHKKPDKRGSSKSDHPRYKEQVMVTANRRQRNSNTTATSNDRLSDKRGVSQATFTNTNIGSEPSPPVKEKEKASNKNANSLLYGVYDEKESAQSFKGALEEWRKGGGNADDSKTSARSDKNESSVSDSLTNIGSEPSPPVKGKENASSRNANSLLYGVYDEKENAQAFKEALEEWRKSGGNAADSKTSARRDKNESSVSVQSPPINLESDISSKIRFDSSLSYMEKLMLKKYRQNEQLFQEQPRCSSSLGNSTPTNPQEDYQRCASLPTFEGKEDAGKQDLSVFTDSKYHNQNKHNLKQPDNNPNTKDSISPINSTRPWSRNNYVGMGDYFQLGVDSTTAPDIEAEYAEMNTNNGSVGHLGDADNCKYPLTLPNSVWDPQSSYLS